MKKMLATIDKIPLSKLIIATPNQPNLEIRALALEALETDEIEALLKVSLNKIKMQISLLGPQGILPQEDLTQTDRGLLWVSFLIRETSKMLNEVNIESPEIKKILLDRMYFFRDLVQETKQTKIQEIKFHAELISVSSNIHMGQPLILLATTLTDTWEATSNNLTYAMEIKQEELEKFYKFNIENYGESKNNKHLQELLEKHKTRIDSAPKT